MPDERSAGAVVYRTTDEGRRYLLMKYRSGHWGFVKGHIEDDESIEQTILREAEEETGIEDLDFHGDFSDHVTYTFQRRGNKVVKRVDFRLARTETEEVELGSPQEHSDMAWVDYEGGKQRLEFDDMRELLEDAHHYLNARQSRLNSF